MYRLEMHTNAHVIDGVCSLSFSPRLSLSLLTELWARDARVCRGLVSGAGGPIDGRAGGRGTRSGRSIAIGAGNASLGYPVTKQVRLARATRPSRHVGLSPLKMMQPKPHCSDAAALERDTCTRRGATKTGSEFLVAPHRNLLSISGRERLRFCTRATQICLCCLLEPEFNSSATVSRLVPQILHDVWIVRQIFVNIRIVHRMNIKFYVWYKR